MSRSIVSSSRLPDTRIHEMQSIFTIVDFATYPVTINKTSIWNWCVTEGKLRSNCYIQFASLNLAKCKQKYLKIQVTL